MSPKYKKRGSNPEQNGVDASGEVMNGHSSHINKGNTASESDSRPNIVVAENTTSLHANSRYSSDKGIGKGPSKMQSLDSRTDADDSSHLVPKSISTKRLGLYSPVSSLFSSSASTFNHSMQLPTRLCSAMSADEEKKDDQKLIYDGM